MVGQTGVSVLDEHCARERHASGCKWAEATQQQGERAVQLDRGPLRSCQCEGVARHQVAKCTHGRGTVFEHHEGRHA